MKKHPLLGACTGLLLATIGCYGGAANAEDLYFTLINKTGVALTEFYVSPTGVDRWESDLLGNNYLPAWSTVEVRIGDGRSTCWYDIGAQFDDGEQVTDFRIDLCETGEYTFYE